MKIAIIISNSRDPNAGTATVSINLAEQFRMKGITCDVIFKEDVLNYTKGVFQQVLFALSLPFKRTLLTYDVLDINAGDGIFVGMMVRWVRRLKRPLLVARSHGLEHVIHQTNLEEAKAGKRKLSWKYPLYHGGYRLWQVKKYLQSADLALFLNAYDREFAVNRLGVDRERAKIVDNGLPELFIGRPFDPTVPEQIKVAMVGSFIERKGIQYAVPALIDLMRANPNLAVGFFGPRITKDRIYQEFDPELRSRVEVVEQYPHQQLPELLENYRILLFSSLGEGFGLAPLEGMACGLAAVVTAIPGVAERLEDGVNALIVPPKDRNAIRTAVQRLTDDPELLLRLRRSGHELAQTFSWTRVADENLQLYEQALRREPGEFSRLAG